MSAAEQFVHFVHAQCLRVAIVRNLLSSEFQMWQYLSASTEQICFEILM